MLMFMANIDIRRRHGLSLHAARTLVTQIATHICDRYDLQSDWQDDSLHLQRTGLKGRIDINEAEIHVRAELGMMLGMLKTTIEREIERELDANLHRVE